MISMAIQLTRVTSEVFFSRQDLNGWPANMLPEETWCNWLSNTSAIFVNGNVNENDWISFVKTKTMDLKKTR